MSPLQHGLTEFENFIKENYPKLYWKYKFKRLVKGGIDSVQKLEELEVSRRLRINGIGAKYIPVLKEIQEHIPEFYVYQTLQADIAEFNKAPLSLVA